MTLDLGFVAHAADRESIKLSVERRGDGTAKRRLADARRAGEADDRTANVAFHDAKRQEFDDSCFDVVEAFVVFGKPLLGDRQIVRILGVCPPWHGRQPLEVVTRDPIFC